MFCCICSAFKTKRLDYLLKINHCSLQTLGRWMNTNCIQQQVSKHKPTGRSNSTHRGTVLPKIYTTSTTQQKQMAEEICVCSRRQTGAAPTRNILFVPLSRRACNPSGNKQKTAVRTGEPAAREAGYADAAWRTCHGELRARFRTEAAGVTESAEGGRQT